jgi:hypothetical protein
VEGIDEGHGHADVKVTQHFDDSMTKLTDNNQQDYYAEKLNKFVHNAALLRFFASLDESLALHLFGIIYPLIWKWIVN